MNLRQVYGYYSRDDVKNFLFNFGKDREVVGVFRSGGFSKRPNVIIYPNDVLAMVKTGIIEFHGSLEHWSQPMSLKSDNYDQLRTGWDLVLDIDCKLFEHGKIASEAFMWGLKRCDLKGASIKFTGGTGFHIGIPWISLPKEVDYKPTAKQYPDLARTIALYLKEIARERFEGKLLKEFSAEDLSKQVNKPLGRIFTEDGIDPYEIVDVDPILLSPRHFFRLPYSLNSKTFFVSLPIKAKDLGEFERMKSKPEKVKVDEGFLDAGEEGEASTLVMEASDWWARKSVAEKDEIKDREWENVRKMGYHWIERSNVGEFKRPIRRKEFVHVVPKSLFPPCVKNISAGLADGKKRSVFALINFLRSSNWDWESIEKYLFEWNEKNSPPLRENLIRSNIRWHKNRNQKILPSNCFKDESRENGYYEDFGVCKPDERCKKIKNPVNYARSMLREKKPKRKARKRRSA